MSDDVARSVVKNLNAVNEIGGDVAELAVVAFYDTGENELFHQVGYLLGL